MVHDRSMPAYQEAMTLREQTRQSLLEELGDKDACLMMGGTNVMHFVGLPSITIPFYLGEDGVPCGLILYGVDEKRLLAAAQLLGRYCPGVDAPCLTVPNEV